LNPEFAVDRNVYSRLDDRTFFGSNELQTENIVWKAQFLTPATVDAVRIKTPEDF